MTVGTRLETDHRGLLSRAQGGDLAAFERLVERHRNDVYGLALRMTRSESEAVDIAQESFLSAYLHLGQFRNEADFSAWVYQIAARHALLRVRPAGIPPVADPVLAAPILKDRNPGEYAAEDWSPHLDEKPLSGELRRAIEEATDALPQGHREVLLFKDTAGLNYEQIANICRVSIPAIKTRLHEARLHLRATIERFYRSQRAVRLAAE